MMLVEKDPQDAVLKGEGVQEGWTCFKKDSLKVQEQAVHTFQRMSQWAGRPTCLKKELWLELREKKKVYNSWKKGQATQEECKDAVRLWWAKAQLEFILASSVK